MKIKTNNKYALLAAISSLIIVLFSCRSVLQANRMSDCQFEFKSFSDVRVAGANIDGVSKLSDLNFFDGAKIAAGFMKGTVPVDMVANVSVYNPNKRTAAVNGLDWIVLLEDTELARGKVAERIEIAPGGRSVVPIAVKMDIAEALKSQDKASLMNFAFNLSAKGGILPSNITIKVKPAISIAGANVKVPGYITVKKQITNQK